MRYRGPMARGECAADGFRPRSHPLGHTRHKNESATKITKTLWLALQRIPESFEQRPIHVRRGIRVVSRRSPRTRSSRLPGSRAPALRRRATGGGAQSHVRCGMRMAGGGDQTHQIDRILWRPVRQRRAFNGDQHVIGTLRDAVKRGDLLSSFSRASRLSPMPMMPPQSRDPGRAHARNGGETLVVGAGRDDLAVELGRRVEVVVVGGQPPRRASAWSCSSIRACSRPPCQSARTPRTISSTRSTADRAARHATRRHAERVAPCSRAARAAVSAHQYSPARYGPRQSCNARLRAVRASRGSHALMLSRTDPWTSFGRVMDAMDALRFETRSTKGSVYRCPGIA